MRLNEAASEVLLNECLQIFKETTHCKRRLKRPARITFKGSESGLFFKDIQAPADTTRPRRLYFKEILGLLPLLLLSLALILVLTLALVFLLLFLPIFILLLSHKTHTNKPGNHPHSILFLTPFSFFKLPQQHTNYLTEYYPSPNNYISPLSSLLISPPFPS